MEEIEFRSDNGFFFVELEFGGVVGKFLPLCDGSFVVINKDNEAVIVHSMDEIIVFLAGGLYSASLIRYQFEEEWKRVFNLPKEPNHLEALLNWSLWEARVLAGLVRY